MAASYLHTKRNANADSLCLTAMVDDGLKYLRNMRRKPVTLQIAIGAGTGWYALDSQSTLHIFSKTFCGRHPQKLSKVAIDFGLTSNINFTCSVTGYAFSKTSKLAAVFAGCSIILLQVLCCYYVL